MALKAQPTAATCAWELNPMLNILKKATGRESENQEGLTLVETMVIVAALAAFASIYTYIVVGALTSGPMSINL